MSIYKSLAEIPRVVVFAGLSYALFQVPGCGNLPRVRSQLSPISLEAKLAEQQPVAKPIIDLEDIPLLKEVSVAATPYFIGYGEILYHLTSVGKGFQKPMKLSLGSDNRVLLNNDGTNFYLVTKDGRPVHLKEGEVLQGEEYQPIAMVANHMAEEPYAKLWYAIDGEKKVVTVSSPDTQEVGLEMIDVFEISRSHDFHRPDLSGIILGSCHDASVRESLKQLIANDYQVSDPQLTDRIYELILRKFEEGFDDASKVILRQNRIISSYSTIEADRLAWLKSQVEGNSQTLSVDENGFIKVGENYVLTKAGRVKLPTGVSLDNVPNVESAIAGGVMEEFDAQIEQLHSEITSVFGGLGIVPYDVFEIIAPSGHKLDLNTRIAYTLVPTEELVSHLMTLSALADRHVWYDYQDTAELEDIVQTNVRSTSRTNVAVVVESPSYATAEVTGDMGVQFRYDRRPLVKDGKFVRPASSLERPDTYTVTIEPSVNYRRIALYKSLLEQVNQEIQKVEAGISDSNKFTLKDAQRSVRFIEILLGDDVSWEDLGDIADAADDMKKISNIKVLRRKLYEAKINLLEGFSEEGIGNYTAEEIRAKEFFEQQSGWLEASRLEQAERYSQLEKRREEAMGTLRSVFTIPRGGNPGREIADPNSPIYEIEGEMDHVIYKNLWAITASPITRKGPRDDFQNRARLEEILTLVRSRKSVVEENANWGTAEEREEFRRLSQFEIYVLQEIRGTGTFEHHDEEERLKQEFLDMPKWKKKTEEQVLKQLLKVKQSLDRELGEMLRYGESPQPWFQAQMQETVDMHEAEFRQLKGSYGWIGSDRIQGLLFYSEGAIVSPDVATFDAPSFRNVRSCLNVPATSSFEPSTFQRDSEHDLAPQEVLDIIKYLDGLSEGTEQTRTPPGLGNDYSGNPTLPTGDFQSAVSGNRFFGHADGDWFSRESLGQGGLGEFSPDVLPPEQREEFEEIMKGFFEALKDF